jgi:hypothetical protein
VTSPAKSIEYYATSELYLTRSLLLEQVQKSGGLQGAALRITRKFSCITNWEELRCVAVNIKSERLMALVFIRQPDGYSSVLNGHNSSEYIRFFIDWGGDKAYQPVSLVQFEVRDAPSRSRAAQWPSQQLVTTGFDIDRYWDCLLNGIQPKVCAVLSWNLKPPEAAAFRPVFGNVIESCICTESMSDVLACYEHASTRLSSGSSLHYPVDSV